MRSSILLIVGLWSVEAAAQVAPPQAKDNTIYITSNLSGDSLFLAIGARLARAGFPLTTTNKEFGQIATGEKIVTDYRYSYYVVVLIEGHKAIVKPTITQDLVLGTYRWYYVPRKATVSYKLLDHLMAALRGVGEVSFGKEAE